MFVFFFAYWKSTLQSKFLGKKNSPAAQLTACHHDRFMKYLFLSKFFENKKQLTAFHRPSVSPNGENPVKHRGSYESERLDSLVSLDDLMKDAFFTGMGQRKGF